MTKHDPTRTDGQSPTGQAALGYAAHGWSVFPIKARGKTPLTRHGFHDATTDPLAIEKWWRRWPDANVGIATGAVSGLVLIDVDAGDGPEVLAALEREFGKLPPTVESLTGGGGRHLFFRHPGGKVSNSAGQLGPGLDVRGDGGYVVAPPSNHLSGGRYEWEASAHPDDVPLAELPGWLLELLSAPPEGASANVPGWVETVLRGVPEGRRNTTATKIAGFYLAQGLGTTAVVPILRSFAERCTPPMQQSEADAVLASVARIEARRRTAAGGNGQADGTATEGAGKEPEVQTESRAKFDDTDLSNTRRLIALHARDLRHCPGLGGWLVWTGLLWQRNGKEAVRRAEDVSLQIERELHHAITQGAANQGALGKQLRKARSKRGISDMLTLAEAHQAVDAAPEHFDVDPWGLNLRDGTASLHTDGTASLHTDETHPHCREDLLTKLAPVDFDRTAQSPTWDRFLARVLPDPNVRKFVQRAIGYSLTGLTSERVLFLLYGSGANGKSTFLETMRSILGDYAQQAPSDLLLQKRNSGVSNDLARLRGARFVTVIETGEGRRLDEALVKQLTGGDMMAARFLYRETFEFHPVAKFWMATNHKPTVRGTDAAIWQRILLVPFLIAVPSEEQDRQLPAKLRRELAGILNWAIEGCVEWQREGLAPPAEVLAATSTYRAEMDVLAAFIEDRCVCSPTAKASAKDLYLAYLAWADENGERHESKRSFGIRLAERGFASRKGTGGRREWSGLGVLAGENGAK